MHHAGGYVGSGARGTLSLPCRASLHVHLVHLVAKVMANLMLSSMPYVHLVHPPGGLVVMCTMQIPLGCPRLLRLRGHRRYAAWSLEVLLRMLPHHLLLAVGILKLSHSKVLAESSLWVRLKLTFIFLLRLSRPVTSSWAPLGTIIEVLVALSLTIATSNRTVWHLLPFLYLRTQTFLRLLLQLHPSLGTSLLISALLDSLFLFVFQLFCLILGLYLLFLLLLLFLFLLFFLLFLRPRVADSAATFRLLATTSRG